MSELKSVSSVRTFLECQERWRYQYVEKLVARVTPAPLQFGIWVHEYLETYYRRVKEWNEIAGVVLPDDPRLSPTPGEAGLVKVRAILEKAELEITGGMEADRFQESAAMLLGIANAYPLWAAQHDTGWKILTVEEAGYVENVYCRRDLTIETSLPTANAGVWVVEHKTHAMGHGGKHEETAPFDIQPLTEIAITPDALGVIYNLIAKPAIRQKQKESRDQFIFRMVQEYVDRADEYFTRRIIRMSGAGAAVRILDAKAMLEALKERGKAKYPQNTAACFAHGTCPYLPLCQGRAEPGDLFDRRPR